MKDMIEITDQDFKVVNTVSIFAIFVIIALVLRSISLPFILIAVIELAIFIISGCRIISVKVCRLSRYLYQHHPAGRHSGLCDFDDHKIQVERIEGNDKTTSVQTALATSIPSVIVSGMELFAATFGVAIYSDIDIISSMCMLMARGAIISMLMVIFVLPHSCSSVTK